MYDHCIAQGPLELQNGVHWNVAFEWIASFSIDDNYPVRRHQARFMTLMRKANPGNLKESIDDSNRLTFARAMNTALSVLLIIDLCYNLDRLQPSAATFILSLTSMLEWFPAVFFVNSPPPFGL